MHELVRRKPVLDLIIESSFSAAFYLNNWNTKKIVVDVALVVPERDAIVEKFCNKVAVIQGPEHDVLSRYVELQRKRCADFIVRLTADCPLIPPFVISKLITLAVMNDYDYVSNVDERCRTAADGFDCEVISKRLLEYVDKNAEKAFDREHVTTLIRSAPPSWCRQGFAINCLDQSNLKLSIDTIEDLNHVRQEYDRIQDKYQRAVQIFGRNRVHQI